jgi:hypothetical protein
MKKEMMHPPRQDHMTATRISGTTAWRFMNNQRAAFGEKRSFQLKIYLFSFHKMSLNSFCSELLLLKISN